LENFTQVIFIVDVAILFILLAGIVWSVASPGSRIWPPPQINSWQSGTTWTFFYLVFFLNALLFILDWDSWIYLSSSRFFLGFPLVVIGLLLLSWGVYALGVRNTSGVRHGLVQDGPYRFTRNPQYIGEIVLFIGLSLISNSVLLWITHGLLILIFLITPFAEETWLEEQYGQNYLSYKEKTPRFL